MSQDNNLNIEKELKTNNNVILSQIGLIEHAIIAQRNTSKESSLPKTPDSLEVFDENRNLTNISKTLLTIYMKNCLNIYKFEFPNMVDKEKNERLDRATVTETTEFDCYGLPSGVQVSNTAQKVFDIISSDTPELFDHPFVPVMGQLGYQIIDNKIRFVHGKDNGIPTRGLAENATLDGNSNHTRLFDKETEQIENSLNYNDFWAYLAAKGKGYSDLSWFIDLMPHEAMHVFGSRGDGLFEGATENLSREMASKYDLRLTPTSHANETILWQKLEKILGREFLTEVDLDLEFDQVNDEYKKAKHNKTLSPELKTKRTNLEEQHMQSIADKLDQEIENYSPDKITEYRENLKRTCEETKKMIMSRISREYSDNDKLRTKKLMSIEEKFQNLDFENQLSRNILDVNEILYESVTAMKTDLGFVEEVYGPIMTGIETENGKMGLTTMLDDIISEKEKDGTIYELGTDDLTLNSEQQREKSKYGKEALSYQYKSIEELQEIITRIPQNLKSKEFTSDEKSNSNVITGQIVGQQFHSEIENVETRKNTMNEITAQSKQFQNQKEGQSLDD